MMPEIQLDSTQSKGPSTHAPRKSTPALARAHAQALCELVQVHIVARAGAPKFVRWADPLTEGGAPLLSTGYRDMEDLGGLIRKRYIGQGLADVPLANVSVCVRGVAVSLRMHTQTHTHTPRLACDLRTACEALRAVC
jgi:hypothetical protein